MIKIGLLGLGTVGTGVLEILEKRKAMIQSLTGHEISIKKILVKDLMKKRNFIIEEGLLTCDFDEIVSDSEIDIIVEVTGDLESSYRYISGGLKAGKHIVTANKAVISRYFEEFSALAEENNVSFLYEASVGGGIPVIKPLQEQLILNEITDVQGILNGTCNYILTRMMDEGRDYKEILKDAQRLGYAEADPSADVDGYDTMRKLRILGTLALQGKICEDDILMDGIRSISSFDIGLIKSMNSTVKLMGEAKAYRDGFTALVQPVIISDKDYFSSVNMAYNSVSFTGSEVGSLKFYGSGAGKLPTANAVLSDVLDIAMSTCRKKNPLGRKDLKNYNAEVRGSYYLRIDSSDESLKNAIKGMAKNMFSNADNIAIITGNIRLVELKELLKIRGIKKDEYFLAEILR